MYVIEVPKRGLPHCHIVIKFKGSGPDTLNEIDKWVWAQLPSEDIAGGLLRVRVLRFMVHRPCEGHNVDSVCMQNNRKTGKTYCNTHYPQPFRTTAGVDDKSGRAEYRRTDNGDNPTIRQRVEGEWRDIPIRNQRIVPYNAYLLLKYNCHICVDVVTAASCVKHLFKCVAKSADTAKHRIAGVSS